MVKKSIDAKVRPIANPSLEKASLWGAARLYVSKDSLIALTNGLESNKPCVVERLIDGTVPTTRRDNTGDAVPAENQPIRREASLCVLPEKNLSPNVVMMTRAFQDATGFRVGDQVRITLIDKTPDIDEVVVKDVSDTVETYYSPLQPLDWASIISIVMCRAEQIFPGMIFKGVSAAHIRRNFEVVRVNGHTQSLGHFNVATSVVRVLGADEKDDGANASNDVAGGISKGKLVLTDVPGLDSQVAYINRFLRGIGRRFIFPGERKSCAVAIHGAHGTGKTFILEKLAATGWGNVFWIKSTDSLSVVRDKFKEAARMQPSMILLDGLGQLIAGSGTNSHKMIEMLGEELDALTANAKTEACLPNVAVVVTCTDYVLDVPEPLRSGSRLYENIVLPVPRASGRREILEFLNLPLQEADREAYLENIALRTHAYNGGDLEDLVRNAMSFARDREEIDQAVTTTSQLEVEDQVEKEALAEEQQQQQQHFISISDIEQALRITRPSIMNDINLNPPTVFWHDIGGQGTFKKVLSRMIKYTANPRPGMSQILKKPAKGLLLYGPPGCSKTLSAQAMATESSMNFFAVKGAELLNMYVGESERAIRTLFQRARVAAPSIIFFDEIDSIAGRRDGESSRSQSSVNIVSTLLTEMDGFETLTGVLILAATNRPDAMDPALLRPGRFDQVVYVGPPDEQAREQIFAVHLRGLKIADDVNLATLARETDGYTGAEIAAICKGAGQTTMERWEDLDLPEACPIRMEDLRLAMKRTPRSITKSMTDSYEAWSKHSGRC